VLPRYAVGFIDIGLIEARVSAVADIWSIGRTAERRRPIERLLHDGTRADSSDQRSDRHQRCAAVDQVSIAGRLLVYLPQECHIGISQRIEDEAERAHLRERLQHLLPAEEKGGFIIRSMAEHATDREMLSDIEVSATHLAGIQEKAKPPRRPRCFIRT
jgi:ribonuclease G